MKCSGDEAVYRQCDKANRENVKETWTKRRVDEKPAIQNILQPVQ
jgi:hypothetical protein